jgi:hypothetical protein
MSFAEYIAAAVPDAPDVPVARRRHKLTNLKIEEVSSVDRGAGKGVQVRLLKRDGGVERTTKMSLQETIQKSGMSFAEFYKTAAGRDAVNRSIQEHVWKMQTLDAPFIDEVRRMIKHDGPDPSRREPHTKEQADSLQDGSRSINPHDAHAKFKAMCDIHRQKTGCTQSQAIDAMMHDPEGQALFNRSKDARGIWGRGAP